MKDERNGLGKCKLLLTEQFYSRYFSNFNSSFKNIYSMVSKKEKKLKKLEEFSYDYDNALAYDITKFFSKLSIKNSNVISFESEFYQDEIFNHKSYSDDKLKENKLFKTTHLNVLNNKILNKIFIFRLIEKMSKQQN